MPEETRNGAREESEGSREERKAAKVGREKIGGAAERDCADESDDCCAGASAAEEGGGIGALNAGFEEEVAGGGGGWTAVDGEGGDGRDDEEVEGGLRVEVDATGAVAAEGGESSARVDEGSRFFFFRGDCRRRVATRREWKRSVGKEMISLAKEEGEKGERGRRENAPRKVPPPSVSPYPPSFRLTT
jgi:hypothetical protein